MIGNIQFAIPGKPKSLTRHKDIYDSRGEIILRRGKGGRLYNPKVDPCKKHKNSFLIESMQYRPLQAIGAPILLACLFHFPLPSKSGALRDIYKEFAAKHWPVIKDGDVIFKISYFLDNLDKEVIRAITHTSDPDTTNLLKFVEDALQGKFWVNDNQIQDLGWKIYSPEPQTEIEILWPK